MAMLTKVLPTIQEEFKSRGDGYKQGGQPTPEEVNNGSEIGTGNLNERSNRIVTDG
jgi:hypothetical protein